MSHSDVKVLRSLIIGPESDHIAKCCLIHWLTPFPPKNEPRIDWIQVWKTLWKKEFGYLISKMTDKTSPLAESRVHSRHDQLQWEHNTMPKTERSKPEMICRVELFSLLSPYSLWCRWPIVARFVFELEKGNINLWLDKCVIRNLPMRLR